MLVGGGAAAATELIPKAALDDLVQPDPSPEVVGRQAAELGVTGLALPAFELDSIADRVRWAREVLRVAAEAQLAGSAA